MVDLYADLHLHSLYSDGTDTPNELIDLAASNHIRVISIADHDSIAAYGAIKSIDTNVKIIPAIEISTVLAHNYLHMLGYYVNIQSQDLINYIQRVSNEKTENTRINFVNAMN